MTLVSGAARSEELGLRGTLEAIAPKNSRAQLASTITGRERDGFVAFTFDDGPHETYTPEVLDTLERFDVVATFFVVGWRFDSVRLLNPTRAEILDDIIARGHDVGNHTWKHHDLTKLTARRVAWEIDKTSAAIARHLGHRPFLFRPPYGALDRTARRVLAKRDFTTVRWNIDAKDYSRTLANSARARVMDGIIRSRGGVVLLHDTKQWSASVLSGILQDLEELNCERLKSSENPIVPVTLDYFLTDSSGASRPVAKTVTTRTQKYLKGLRSRCATFIDKR